MIQWLKGVVHMKRVHYSYFGDESSEHLVAKSGIGYSVMVRKDENADQILVALALRRGREERMVNFKEPIVPTWRTDEESLRAVLKVLSGFGHLTIIRQDDELVFEFHAEVDLALAGIERLFANKNWQPMFSAVVPLSELEHYFALKDNRERLASRALKAKLRRVNIEEVIEGELRV